MTIEQRIARNIKLMRASKSLTQMEIARRSGMSQGYIVKIEKGEGNVTLRALEKLSIALESAAVGLKSDLHAASGLFWSGRRDANVGLTLIGSGFVARSSD